MELGLRDEAVILVSFWSEIGVGVPPGDLYR
jgi:hypothetical protein